ncbi:Crp/Fnr family transcriptional regulator [Brevundimonas goettingensis]|uniref:Crp/Fnr family transcriptional regulator n=1 Tax=Brevundimonas goettingensis TaxID=2774190 RepID=A0A975C305_9CAUL|nr:Crp/Fnr family transcriptional regulator [Brevundimonas goettingensis]QTC91519.1 Crp/Fnr family transcriptional regulator [Brevundimonas goettingensis]
MLTATLHNSLIQNLPPEDRAALIAASVPVDFKVGHVFLEAGDQIEHVHFLNSGIISAVAAMKDGRTVEVFMVGREGVTHPSATGPAPVRSYSRHVAQAEGQSRRIEVSKLRELMNERHGLRAVIAGYASGLQAELEQSGTCNALHRADQRFAKWLLRCHDRIDGETLHLTQEYLGSMLGAQRTTVNEAAQTLQKAGAINYSRGKITITNRAALERMACECYNAGGGESAARA